MLQSVLNSSMHCCKLHLNSKYLMLALAGWLIASVAPAQTFTNRALKLNGTNSYLQLPPNIFNNLTQATVEVWAKWAEFGSFSRVFEFGAGYHSISLFNHSTNSDLRFNIYPRFAKAEPKWMFTATARGLLRANEWMHIAAVSGPGGMKLYANGRLVAQHTNQMTFADIKASHTNVIGHGLARGPSDRDFKGEIDEIRVWDHQRSLAEIRDNMFKRLSGHEDGLTHLWNFDDGTVRDSGPDGHDGKLVGKARVGRVADLELTAPPTVVAAARAPLATNSAAGPISASAPAPAPIHVAVTAPANQSNMAAWWIAGSLLSLVALLACLLLMLRRSGIVTPKALPAGGATQALPPGASVGTDGPGHVDQQLKERALADLTDFAKQSLVQGLYSQRAALLEVHQKAQQELAELESRVVALRLPERIQAYEQRIAELERQLETRGEELRELTQATLQVLREKLAEERGKQSTHGRLN